MSGICNFFSILSYKKVGFNYEMAELVVVVWLCMILWLGFSYLRNFVGGLCGVVLAYLFECSIEIEKVIIRAKQIIRILWQNIADLIHWFLI